MLSGPLIDVASYSGRVVLARRWVAPPASEAHFHADLLWNELVRRVAKIAPGKASFARLSAIAATGFEHAWWFAGLQRSEAYFLVRRASAQLAFLEHARQNWPTLTSIGPRYAPTNEIGEIPTLVNFCLARQGAPIVAPPFLPLTPIRLTELLDVLPGRHVVQLLADGKNAEAVRLLNGHSEIPTLSLAEHLVDAGMDALACRAVRGLSIEDSHDIVRDWLTGEGDPTRIVR